MSDNSIKVETAIRSLMDVDDLQIIIDNAEIHLKNNYKGQEHVLDNQIVSAGVAVSIAKDDDTLFRFLLVKQLIEKTGFGDGNEGVRAYMRVYEDALDIVRKGFCFNIAKDVESDFYNDIIKQLLY